MNEFERRIKKDIMDKYGFKLLIRDEVMAIVSDARQDLLRELSEDDIFVFEEYGLEKDENLTPGAIELKHEILVRVGHIFWKWFVKWLEKDKQQCDVCSGRGSIRDKSIKVYQFSWIECPKCRGSRVK